MKIKLGVVLSLSAFTTVCATGAWAGLVIQDNFTGSSSSYDWKTFNGACLTAGDGSGSIPKCVGLPYYTENLVGGYNGASGSAQTLPDPAGNGALRFTNGYPGGYQQNGAVVSNFTFPTGEGLQVTFTTVTYRGDSGGAGADGADGISFFLMDGSKNPGIGAWGGSLGYSCSNTNTPYDGLVGAYLGLGIDEYGNFLNGTSLMAGYSGSNSATGDNAALGYGYKPGRIGLRGAGSVSWAALNGAYSSNPSNASKPYYPSSLSSANKLAAVKKTCQTGHLWNYSSASSPTDAGATSLSNSVNTAGILDYAPIPNAYKELPSSLKIANESAMKRGNAQPITYKLKITSDGLLSFWYSYNGGAFQSVLTNQSITASNGPLPSTFRFGFAGSTGGSTNIHEIMCFNAQPAELSSSSAGLNEKETAKVQTGTQVYFAFYNPNTWAGSLTSQNLLYNATTKTVSIASTANWDASCVLTGVASGKTCTSTGQAGPVAAQGSSQRSILTWDGTKGIPFQWANLTTAQQNTLTAGDSSSTANRLNFLRGDRSNEVNSSGVGLYRARDSVLGDIIDSSPTWVGPPSAPYTATWKDRLYPGASMPENSGQSYTQFISSAQTRLNVVYSGANDGLLHALRSGSYDSSGNYVDNSSTPNDGKEVLAYMPAAVVNTIHNSSDSSLDFSNTQYGHNFFVDAPPGMGDLYYGGAWHTWLIGGLGPGGAALYAMDVTNPANFSEGNAASLVVGEWNSANLTCANVANCNKNLGNTFGMPQIRRFHNGSWGAVFGNGFGSVNGGAGVFIMLVDSSTGSRSFYYLATSGSTSGNGIAYATPADLDGDHVTDYIYAGDLKGNVWRFDVTSSDPSQWAASSSPLFTTSTGQPITTQVMVASIASSNSAAPRILVEFGTGQQIPFTNSSPTTYASGTQALYGVWDWNMSSWNAKSTTQYTSLSAPQTISVSNLQTQTILGTYNNTYRTVSTNPICWKGSTACSTGNTQFGWTLSLPGGSEQVLYSPTLEVSSFIVNTTIPASNSPTDCNAATATGWTMAINPATGGAFKNSVFGDANRNFVTINGQIVSGMRLNGTGSVSIVTDPGGGTDLVTQTVSGAGAVVAINPPAASGQGSRITWLQRR